MESQQPSSPQPPWYESNLFWGPVALAVGIVLTVVAAMKHDLRCLLWFAWACFEVAIWSLARRTRRALLASILILDGVLVGGGLLGINHWLHPEQVSTAGPTLKPTVPATRETPAPQPMTQSQSPATTPRVSPPKSSEVPPTPLQARPQTGNAASKAPTAPSGSIVQNNSGGVNVQQGTTGTNSPIIDSPITIGTLGKAITPKNKAVLAALFLNAKAKCRVLITADQHNAATPLPQDFLDVLVAGKWPVSGVDAYTDLSAATYGSGGAMVMIRSDHSNEDQDRRFDDSEPIFYILKALQTENIRYVIYRSPLFTENTIKVDFRGIYAY